MGFGLNKVILIGNLGKDPEIRGAEGSVPMASFPLATTESFKNKDGQREERTEWHNIVLFRAQAEYAQKALRKGLTVMIEGKLKTRSREDRDGVKRYTTEIIGEHVLLLNGSRREDADGQDRMDY